MVLMVGVGLGKGPKSPVSRADSVALKPLLMNCYALHAAAQSSRVRLHLVTEVSVRKSRRIVEVEEARAKEASGELQVGVTATVAAPRAG